MGSKYKDTHQFLSKELFNAFGKQFCKHEVLWKPDPSWTECQIQLARHDAYKMLTQALNLSMEAVLELSEIFPAACLDLMSYYEKGSRPVADSPMPDWLMPMAERFKLHNVSMKDFVKGMCDSAREGLMGDEEHGGKNSSPLLGPRAVARYAALRRVKKRKMLTVWRRVYKMCLVKLRASLAAGDCQGILPETLTMDRSEREIADLALLNDADITQISDLTPSKLQSLVILFHLIVAAKDIYDREQKRMRDDIINNEMTANNENVNKTTPMIGVCNETLRSTDSYKSTKTIGTYTYSTQNLVQEKVTECKQTDDIYGKVEGSSELNLSPEVLVISSDISDNEISNTDYKDGMDVFILKNKNSYTRRFLDSNYNFKKNWYEKSKCNASEEQREIWALVYTDFIKRGRSASLVSLQHRWVELLHRCRTALLTAWESNTHIHTNMHPLLLVVAHRFPEIVTESLPSWRELVTNRQIVLESDIKHTIRKYLEIDSVFLHINEKLVNRSLIKTYMNENDLNDVQSQSNSNAINKHSSYQINDENPATLQFCNPDINKVAEVERLLQKSGEGIEVNSNNCISTMLEQIDPSKAKVSIIVEDDVDEDLNETLHLENIQREENVSNIEEDGTCLRKESNQIPHALGKCNKDNIEKELQDKLDDMIDKVNIHNDLFVTNNKTLNDNNENEHPKDEYLEEVGEKRFGNSEPGFDEKLVKLSHVVITPIEDLPEWKKHSRNGVMKCRNFSVKNFTKPVVINSDKLHKCRPYVNRHKDTCDIKSEKDSDSYESDDYMKKEVRIKFEDDNFETDYDFSEDINNGITCQKYIELYSMTDDMRKTRIRLTKKLKLPRTYFSLNFWNLDNNIELMKLCKPLQIKLSKTHPRVAKRVPLSDNGETAVSSRSMDTTPADAQRSSASREAGNSINSSDPLNLNTTKQTDNSLSSDTNSSELLKILKTYTIEKNIPKQSAVDSATKNNLMDSIIETMRLTEKNNIENSVRPLKSSEQSSYLSSNPSESESELLRSSNTNISEIIPATDAFNNTQKATEEVPNISKQISSHISLLPSKIHISSHSTKDLYTKHLQGMKNVRDVFSKLGEKKELNVCSLKNMLHLLAKNNDKMANHEYNDDMKLSRQSLSLHLKKFEKEQNALVKEITKQTKILPTYEIKEESNVPKIKTKKKKRKKINLIQKEQTKQPSDTTGNIKDVAVDKNSVLFDDDNEPKLVIDERIEEPSGNNSQCNKINKNMNIVKTLNETKKDKKEKKKGKKSTKRNKKPKNNSEEEKPILNEYQEWQRQKTMALKYFTLPMTDTSKIRSKEKIVISQSTGTQTQQICQTNVSMKRRAMDLIEKSTDITKRPKLQANDSDVFYISDDSSEDDVQIVGCSVNTGTVNIDNTITATPQIEITEIPKTNNVNNIQVPNQNVCVINTPMTSITQPLYVVINGNQIPMNTQEIINRQETINNQVFLQVFSNGVAPFSNEIPTVPQNDIQQTQISNTPPCQRAINNRCNKDYSTCSISVLQNVIYDDSRTDKPSTSLKRKLSLKETLAVDEFIRDIKKPTALIKVDGSQNQLFFCNKYIILTDVNILSTNASYRTLLRSKKYKLLSQVLFPSGSDEGRTLQLEPKEKSDYLQCKCMVGLKDKCFLCNIVENKLQKCTNLLKIHDDYYKKICENPLKYVRLNDNDMVMNSRDVLESNPDLMLFNRMYFKKLRDKPLKYVRMLSSVPDFALLRHLVFKEVRLYVLDVTQTKNYYKSLIYKRTAGKVTVHHRDDSLVKNLQLILNC